MPFKNGWKNKFEMSGFIKYALRNAANDCFFKRTYPLAALIAPLPLPISAHILAVQKTSALNPLTSRTRSAISERVLSGRCPHFDCAVGRVAE
jgi:hypothetical protein